MPGPRDATAVHWEGPKCAVRPGDSPMFSLGKSPYHWASVSSIKWVNNLYFSVSVRVGCDHVNKVPSIVSTQAVDHWHYSVGWFLVRARPSQECRGWGACMQTRVHAAARLWVAAALCWAVLGRWETHLSHLDAQK